MDFRRYDCESRLDGFKDYYCLSDAGSGSDCIVWLHGHNGDGYQPFLRPDVVKAIEPLVKKYSLSMFSPNLRGNAWMSQAAADDLYDLLTALKREHSYRRLLFVCGSMGGTGGLIFASLHPELVDGMVVLGAATDLARYHEYLLTYHKESGRDIFLEIARAIMDNHTPETLEKFSVCKNFEKLTMPLVFCHGREDYVMPVSEMYELQKRMYNFPNAEFRSVPGAHNAPIEFLGSVFEKIYAPAVIEHPADELDIIIPVSLDTDWISSEDIAANIMEQYRLFGFTKFALAMPGKGWRSRCYPPESFFVERAEAFNKITSMLPDFIKCGWWHTLVLKSGPTSGITRIKRIDGSESPFASCPLDPEYRRRFTRDVATVVSICKPAFICTEDDFSLSCCHGGSACFCEHHLEAFALKMGRRYSREELESQFKEPEASRELLRSYQELLKESLVQFAQAIRAAVDTVAPEIPIGFMQPGGNLKDGNPVEAIARALAGKNHRPWVRFNGTFYGAEFISSVTARLFNCLYYKQHIQGDFGFYHESDSYPHTRFFVSSSAVRALMSEVYSYGYDGSTFQTQQILDDPSEEKALGRMFVAERKRFNALKKKRAGCRIRGIQVHHEPFDAANFPKTGADWLAPLTYMGIPYSTVDEEIAVISGNQLRFADNETIIKYLSGNLFLDGLAAEVLCQRGYGEYLGAEVSSPLITGNDKFDLEAREIINLEFIPGCRGRNMPRGDVFSPFGNGEVHKITITDPECEEVTRIVNSLKEPMAPGMTRFRNKLGGKIIIYATEVYNNASNNLFNYRRQKLFQELICWCSDYLPMVKNDPRIGLIVNEAPADRDFTALLTCINLCPDPLEKLELHLPEAWREKSDFKIMDQEGSWQCAAVEKTPDGIILHVPMRQTEPVYLLIGK